MKMQTVVKNEISSVTPHVIPFYSQTMW